MLSEEDDDSEVEVTASFIQVASIPESQGLPIIPEKQPLNKSKKISFSEQSKSICDEISKSDLQLSSDIRLNEHDLPDLSPDNLRDSDQTLHHVDD